MTPKTKKIIAREGDMKNHAKGMKKRRLRSIFFVVLIISISSTCFAEESFKYQFAHDFIRALGCLQDISGRVKEIKDDDEMLKLLTATNRNVLKSKEAHALMEKFLRPERLSKFSTEEQDVVPTIVGIFYEINELSKASLKMLEGLSSDEITVSIKGKSAVPQATNNLIGSQRNAARTGALLEEAYKRLFYASLLVGQMLTDYPNGQDKPVLDMTLEEKQSLLRELEFVFGDEVKEGVKTGQPYLKGAGAGLYQALNQSWQVKER